MITRIILSSCESKAVNISSDKKLSNLKYRDDCVILGEDPRNLLVFLDSLNDSIGMFGMHFAPSRCKMLLQHCIGSKPNLVFADGVLGVVDRFNYFGNFISPGGCTLDGVCSRIQKDRLISINLRYLWDPCDIRVSIESGVYKAAVKSVPFCDSQTWHWEMCEKFWFEHPSP